MKVTKMNNEEVREETVPNDVVLRFLVKVKSLCECRADKSEQTLLILCNYESHTQFVYGARICNTVLHD